MQTMNSKMGLFCVIGMLLFTIGSFSQDDDYVPENFSKLRLGFYSHTGFYRQVLLGFQNANATDGIDPGYDAINTFNLPNDMYFYCANTELFIQGVGYFNNSRIFPLGIKSNASGSIIIKLESTEYFSPEQTFYIYDNQTQQYHNLKSGNFQISVGAGVFNERFSLRFLNQSVLGIDNQALNNGVKLSFFTQNNELSITNTLQDVTVKSVILYNISGQEAGKWDISSGTQKETRIPLSQCNSGIYIVHVTTTAGTLVKKIKITR